MTQPLVRGALMAISLTLLPALTQAQTRTETVSLDDAVESALATHPALGASSARSDAAQEGVVAARAARLPTLAIEASGLRFQEPMLVAPLHRFDPTTPPRFDETLIQGRLGLQYTLFDAGSRSARVRGANAAARATEAGGASAEMDVIEQATAAYLAVLASRAVVDAAEALVEAYRVEADRARRSVDVGTAAEVEAMRAAATLQDAIAKLAGAEARAGFAERSLERLTGWAPGTVRDRGLLDLDAPGAATTLESAGASQAAGVQGSDTRRFTNPSVAQAEGLVRAAEARVADERSGRLPQLVATAGLVDYGSLTGKHVAEWQGGLKITWPVFTGGARSAAVRRAEAEALAAREDQALVEMRIASAVDEAHTSLTEATTLMSALELGVSQWQEVARIEALALEAGSGVQGDLLRAQAGLFQARAGYARARYDAVFARVRLAHAHGILDRRWLNEALEMDR